MKVLFIGQNPSQTNLDINVAFVGSRSYHTLLEWVRKLGLKPGEVGFVNASKKIGDVTLKDADFNNLFSACCTHEKVICLGKYAEKCYQKIARTYGWSYKAAFSLPHPSGLNRKLNNPEYVQKILEECKNYLYA